MNHRFPVTMHAAHVGWAGTLSLLVGLLVGCGSAGSQRAEPILATRAPEWTPEELDDGWTVASARDVGLDACLLDSMTEAIRRGADYVNVHAVLIVKDDRPGLRALFQR